MDILARLFDEKILKILKEVQGEKIMQIREVARSTKLPPSTVHRIFQRLEKIGLLHKENIGTVHIYKVNQTSEIYNLIERIIPRQLPLDIFMSQLKSYPIDEILLIHSQEEMSNLVIIGDIKAETVQNLTDNIKKDFNHSIRTLVLSKVQYNNLEALNMKPTYQKILYKKQ